MLNILKRLLYIKEHREKKAESAMLSAYQTYLNAVESVKKTQLDLEKYISFMAEEEGRLYKNIIGKTIKVNAIEEIRDHISALRGKKIEYEERIKELEKEREDAAEEHKKKKELHAKAMKITKKYVELVDIYSKKQYADELREEDDELDEVASFGAMYSNVGNRIKIDE